MKRLRIYWAPQLQKSPLLYTFEELLRPLGIEWEAGEWESLSKLYDDTVFPVFYAPSPPETPPSVPCLFIPSTEFFGRSYRHKDSLPSSPLTRVRDISILIGKAQSSQSLFGKNSSGGISMTFDLPASFFFLLSGYEEYFDQRQEPHDRFAAAGSMLDKEGLLETPAANLYQRVLSDALKAAAPDLQMKPVWEMKKSRFILTHDVDTLTPPSLKQLVGGVGRTVLGRENLSGPAAFMKSALARRKRPRDDHYLTALLDIDHSYGFAPTVFLVAGHKARLDPTYSLKSAAAQKLFRKLRDVGGSIALHGSYRAAYDPALLLNEKDILEKISGSPIRAHRSHYLRWDRRGKTLRAIESAGLVADSTLGDYSRPGFRRGTCYPFRLYDLERDRISPVWEVPLITMDIALLRELGNDRHKMTRKVQELASAVSQFKGCFTLLWHNFFLDPWLHPSGEETYRDILTNFDGDQWACDSDWPETCSTLID